MVNTRVSKTQVLGSNPGAPTMNKEEIKKLHKLPGIYKITNIINNKSYVGYAPKLKQRILKYLKPSDDSLLCKDIIKYGLDNFKLDILSENPNDILQDYINKYNPEYNISIKEAPEVPEEVPEDNNFIYAKNIQTGYTYTSIAKKYLAQLLDLDENEIVYNKLINNKYIIWKKNK